MAMKRSSGRPRSSNDRHACGKVIQSRHEGHATKEAIAQRIRLVGADNALDPRAGYPLGILTMRGIIETRHHDAGMRFQLRHRLWAIATQSRAPWPQVGLRDGGPVVLPEETCERAEEVFLMDWQVLQCCAPARAVIAAVDAVVINMQMPQSAKVVDRLLIGLDGLARHYRIV